MRLNTRNVVSAVLMGGALLCVLLAVAVKIGFRSDTGGALVVSPPVAIGPMHVGQEEEIPFIIRNTSTKTASLIGYEGG